MSSACVVLGNPGRSCLRTILLLWLLVPFIVSFSPVKQDGVRYIMPSLLALSMADRKNTGKAVTNTISAVLRTINTPRRR